MEALLALTLFAIGVGLLGIAAFESIELMLVSLIIALILFASAMIVDDGRDLCVDLLLENGQRKVIGVADYYDEDEVRVNQSRYPRSRVVLYRCEKGDAK